MSDVEKAELIALVEKILAAHAVAPVGPSPEEVEALKQVAKAEGVLAGIAQEKALVLAEVMKLEDLLK